MEELDLIDEILEDVAAISGERRERCPEATLEKCIIDFPLKFGISLPVEYVDFLRKSNGIFFEDAAFCYLWDVKLNELYPTHELFEVNERYRHLKLPKKFAILGFEEKELFVYNAMEDFYARLNISGYDILKKFESFEEIFQEAMEGTI